MSVGVGRPKEAKTSFCKATSASSWLLSSSIECTGRKVVHGRGLGDRALRSLILRSRSEPYGCKVDTAWQNSSFVPNVFRACQMVVRAQQLSWAGDGRGEVAEILLRTAEIPMQRPEIPNLCLEMNCGVSMARPWFVHRHEARYHDGGRSPCRPLDRIQGKIIKSPKLIVSKVQNNPCTAALAQLLKDARWRSR
jgi:hypothetical protein